MNKKIHYMVFTMLFLLMSGYVYLNYWKVNIVTNNYHLISDGNSAIVVNIYDESNMPLSSKHLPESDIFDSSGNKHISIITMEKSLFSQLKESKQPHVEINNIKSDLNLARISQEPFFIAEFKNRSLFIVPKKSPQVVAHIMWKYNKSKDIISCTPHLCKNIRLSKASWADLQGPFLETDIVDERRGLPRGRWAFGPATPMRIQSRISADIFITIDMLTFIPDLKLKYSGNITAAKSNSGSARKIGMYTMYPRTLTLKVSLQPGNNDIKLNYSKWENTGTPRPGRSVYFTSLSFNEK